MVTQLVNNDFADVVFNRHAVRSLDRDHKISRDEILEIVREATKAPSAVDSQPWHFVFADTDAGKDKVESFMYPVDKGRIENSSTSVIVFADKGWYDHIDEVFVKNAAECGWPDELLEMFREITGQWIVALTDGGDTELEHSVIFQAGLVAMQLILCARAHGYETGPMDAFIKDGLAEAFGLDGDRFIPVLMIGIGKPIEATREMPTAGVAEWGTVRREPEEVTTFA